jgi:hypothetical protein
MEITLEKSRMENPEQLATLGPKTERKIYNTICVGQYYEQTNTTNVNKT